MKESFKDLNLFYTVNLLFKKNSIFRKMFIYIISSLLIITLVFQLILYAIMYYNIKNSVMISNESVLNSIVTLAETKFSILEDSIYNMAWDETVLDVTIFPNHKNSYRNLEVVKNLKSFVKMTEYVSKVALVSLHDEVVYTSLGEVFPLDTYSYAADFSSSLIGRIGDNNYYLLGTENGDVCILYEFIEYSRGHLGKLLIYLDSAELFTVISSGSQNLYITTEDSSLIFSSNPNNSKSFMSNIPYLMNSLQGISNEERDNRIMYKKSSFTDLIFFYSYSPVHLTLGNYLSNKNVLASLFIILPLLSILAFIVSNLFYNPLRKMLHSIESSISESDQLQLDEWNILNRFIKNLNEKNYHFSNIISEVAPHIFQNMLVSLIEGTNMSSNYIDKTINGIQSSFAHNGNFVFYISCNRFTRVFNPAAIPKTIQRLKNLRYEDCNIFSFEYNYSIYTLVDFGNPSYFELNKRIDEIQKAIYIYTQNLKDNYVEHSSVFHELSEIRAAYQQIYVQLEEDVAKHSSSIKDIETYIEKSVLILTEQSVDAGSTIISNLIYSISNTNLDKEKQLHCYNTLLYTMNSLAKEYNIPFNEHINGFDIVNSNNISEHVYDYCQKLLSKIFVKLDNRQHKYFTEANSYMENNYSNPNLSLEIVANKVGISASYLSRIFADEYKMKFTRKLNEIRIEKAKKLLEDQKKLIKDISEEVGFLTIQNFMRVFKQQTGITATEYRSTL